MAPKPAAKPVVAVRGDDRPGMRKEAPAAPAGRGGKFGDRKDGARPWPRCGQPPPDVARVTGGRDGFTGRDRPTTPWQEAPRLGDTAFRAQRDALDNAQFALRKLAAQAHGEALTQLLTAWEKRDATLVPSTQDLGAKIGATVRTAWMQGTGGSRWWR